MIYFMFSIKPIYLTLFFFVYILLVFYTLSLIFQIRIHSTSLIVTSREGKSLDIRKHYTCSKIEIKKTE